MISKNNIFTLILLMSIISLQSFSQQWKVPDRKKKKTAPVKFTPENIKKGEMVFNANCVACHGIPGKMNFAKITPLPGDPASDKFQENTDGEMFFKISTGKLPMPSFKNTVSDEDRWNVISYLRSFNKNYVQPEPRKDEGTDYTVFLKLSHEQEKNAIIVKASATSKKSLTPEIVIGADVTLYAQRRFGLLQIDKKKVTNNNGAVIFNFPADLPGDTAGIVNVVVKLSDEIGDYGEAESSAKFQIGKRTIVKSLIDTRAMWTVGSQAPIWLILSYCSIVLIIFGCVVFILMQLIKLRKLGIKPLENNKNE